MTITANHSLAPFQKRLVSLAEGTRASLDLNDSMNRLYLTRRTLRVT